MNQAFDKIMFMSMKWSAYLCTELSRYLIDLTVVLKGTLKDLCPESVPPEECFALK